MNRSLSIIVRCLLSSALAGGTLGLAAPVLAQEVVQALPNPASADLAEAMRRLSREPQSIPALLQAGTASLALDDLSAAYGFLTRAQAIEPDDGRVLAALGMLAVRRGEAVTAIQLFDNADAAGEVMTGYAADRGLAYDLVGNNARAQRLYRQALTREEDAETIRRLALSYAISGDAAASEAILLPMLQRQDRAAYRTRAFALAILGRDDEAVAIAETMLPGRISRRLAPYLRYMPRLTRAQQATAANLGRFPAVADIGQDDAEIGALTAAAETTAPQPAGDARLIPGGEPLGPQRAAAEVVSQPAPQPVLTPVTTPVQNTAPPAASGELPALVVREVEQAAPQAPSPAEVVVAQVEAAMPAPQPEPQPPVPGPAFSLSEPESPAIVTVLPESRAEAVVQTLPPVELADAFADFSLEAVGGTPISQAPGAVDITAITPPRERPEPPAPPPPPAHPSRHWVQIATGQDLAAFRFDLRRLQRTADGLLDGREAYHARWNQTNRLLVGPFESTRAAQQFVSELGAAGIDAFRFTSALGEEVARLP